MKRIIVVGAGHGGVIAAAKLAKSGFDVTVFEKKKREDLGHDWEDRFTFSLLSRLIEKSEKDFPEGCWRYRGDCAFVSPAKRKKVIINYNDDNRQKIMWRVPLLNMLIDYAEKCGVNFIYSTEVYSPVIDKNFVTGIVTSGGVVSGDMVIDAAGAFSPIRKNLPDSAEIEKDPRRGDLFYAYRAYYKRDTEAKMPEVPFEVYMYHEGEKGLSWFCTNDDNVDILIGRIDPINDVKVKEQVEIFRKSHPWFTDEILHGGNYGIIPVRRPLSLMVYNGYAAVGDSAFMTTPMNGMGIDLSLLAGELLAKTIKKANGDFSRENLWEYNREFHKLYGGETAKNEGLKNSILSIPSEGVDFLFENDVIQSSDLAGAGKNTNISALLGKAARGMKNPPFFLAIINGLIQGGRAASTYKNAPEKFDILKIRKWSKKIESFDIKIP
ncbi:MAG: NAD(P)/FAD-dependent oxidoreductase [Clostridia bacterium]|nr:NAD(P)/FAD-dependent oxidoreductase [Clostridia bacterium]